MKILLGNEELEVIEAGTNKVVFYSEGDEDSSEYESDDDDDDDGEVGFSNLPALIYKIKLYKNAQAQNVDKIVKVKASNFSIQALTETAAVLILVNNLGQAVYTVAWDLVHSIDSEEAELLSPK